MNYHLNSDNRLHSLEKSAAFIAKIYHVNKIYYIPSLRLFQIYYLNYKQRATIFIAKRTKSQREVKSVALQRESHMQPHPPLSLSVLEKKKKKKHFSSSGPWKRLTGSGKMANAKGQVIVSISQPSSISTLFKQLRVCIILQLSTPLR